MTSLLGKRSAKIVATLLLALVASNHAVCNAFSLKSPSLAAGAGGTVCRGAPLYAAGVFGGLFGKKQTEDPNAPKRIFDVPVDSIKMGGLRFALGLHLIGQQGNPEKGTWKANEASDGILDMYFKDETGMFSVAMSENSISVDRYGPRPSLQYLLQESVLLHDFLDELQTLAFEGDDIEDENRLLKPKDGAIEKARESLPARKA
eukprot:CAMPEP_0183291314 /NCGR_PEP_ID=MMETSP0160_2-20130417/781_1 /TAXON_ID=2839 ORGANISM="Odontella Sinensis, Strain Grunow 1884" /NCGR_SAMPLE_ID=MMETSP0160_2 /ASSEMBLY_ACC=CAM_ASM_000250 /LENGTH=203 /DNA_ID=CAMNT_0025452111 /DNA_START=78 /DNA_END=689 /DNA_ORIENTATION=+